MSDDSLVVLTTCLHYSTFYGLFAPWIYMLHQRPRMQQPCTFLSPATATLHGLSDQDHPPQIYMPHQQPRMQQLCIFFFPATATWHGLSDRVHPHAACIVWHQITGSTATQGTIASYFCFIPLLSSPGRGSYVASTVY